MSWLNTLNKVLFQYFLKQHFVGYYNGSTFTYLGYKINSIVIFWVENPSF